MGSRTIYWRSLDKIGITDPPAESIAAVDPAAVETLKPLDRECSKDELGLALRVILLRKQFTYKIKFDSSVPFFVFYSLDY